MAIWKIEKQNYEHRAARSVSQSSEYSHYSLGIFQKQELSSSGILASSPHVNPCRLLRTSAAIWCNGVLLYQGLLVQYLRTTLRIWFLPYNVSYYCHLQGRKRIESLLRRTDRRLLCCAHPATIVFYSMRLYHRTSRFYRIHEMSNWEKTWDDGFKDSTTIFESVQYQFMI